MTTPPPTSPTPPDRPMPPPAPRRGPGGWSSNPNAFDGDRVPGEDQDLAADAHHRQPPRVVVEAGQFADRSDEGPADPTDLPLFASSPVTTPSTGDSRPGRVRSDFALRPQPGLSQTPGAHQAAQAAGHRAPAPSAASDASAGQAGQAGAGGGVRAGTRVDWDQVGDLRSRASDQLTAALEAADGRLDEEARRQLGRSIIHELLQEEVAEQVQRGRLGWSVVEQNELAKVIFDALFGLGRLQPLVDDERVENIIIAGCDNVWLELDDGTLVRGPAVAESDEQLIGDLVFLAERSQTAARTFSESTPRLHMRLPGGARLAAAAWVTPRPSVVIRRHRLRRVTFEDNLVPNETFSPLAADFLRACIRSRKSVVVCGHQGAGKTTAVRALCACMDPWEAIGTFETEYELHLNELTDQHLIVHAWEARPGSGEVGINGRRAGEFTLDEALYDSFRFNLSRQIVGEVRGPEVWAMIKAMEAGSGSLSTVHARDASAALRRLATCAQEAGPQVTSELAHSKLAETIDIVVHMHMETTPRGDGTFQRRRWVNEIIAVEPGEDLHGWATTHVFAPNPEGGPAVPYILPDYLRHDLAGYGFGPEKAREFQSQASLHPLHSVDQVGDVGCESGGGRRP
ncbi:MAG: ATPase, T2SS/T4P/T4SS family [Nocardioides sp.]